METPKMKISSETINAIESQMEAYRSRIQTYNITIKRLSKMQNAAVVSKSIEGYEKQVQFLQAKIDLLETDLTYLKTLV